MNGFRMRMVLLSLSLAIMATSCGIYTFKDVSIPPEIKTVKIGFIENKATYVNPRLSSQLTDAFVKMIASQTKLTRVDNNDADYVINSTITNYTVSTSGISAKQTSLNRLTVGVQMTLIDNVNKATKEYDVSTSFDFDANLSLQQAETNLMSDIIKNTTEAMFNKIFSGGW